MLYFKLYPFSLLKQSHVFDELLQYYQPSNNLPQSAQTLDFDIKSCQLCLAQQIQSLCSSSPSHSFFVALASLGSRVALLVVDFSRLSQPFLLCVEHLNSLCSLFSCLWQLSKLSKYSYFRRTSSCKLLSSLPIAFPSAHVSFA